MIVEAASIAAAATTAVLTQGAFHPRSQIFGPLISRMEEPCDERIALTFDDGPTPKITDHILAILEQYNMHATFFVIGHHAAQHANLLKDIHAAGHELANHTYHHHRHGLFRHRRYWEDQIERTDDIIAGAIGSPPFWFRPPMGFKSPAIAKAARRSGHEIVTWTRRAFDGRTTSSAAIEKRLVDQIKPGDIILMHDGFEPGRPRDLSPIVDALPRILDSIDRNGLRPSLLPCARAPGTGERPTQEQDNPIAHQ